MGWLGRLVGREPPLTPTGGQAYVSSNGIGSSWCVRVVMGDKSPTYADKQISPTFELQTTAYAWLDWLEDPKGKPFTYPEGEA